MHELDRILLQEPVVSPSREFTRDVMAAVHREAMVPPPIEFPWRRFLVGVGTNIALLIVSLVLVNSAYKEGSGSIDAVDLLAVLRSPVTYGLTAAAATTLACMMIIWLALLPMRRGIRSF